MSRRLSALFQPMQWRLSRPAPRAKNDYATHIPVLIGLAKSRVINSVLELGSGNYSTKTFLNRKAFPHLKVLDSYETDRSWALLTADMTTNDPRAHLHLVRYAMAEVVSAVNLATYDLVFVDDSQDFDDRVRTIRALAERRAEVPLVLIHDFEVPEYITASRGFPYRYSFRAINPETGVVWNEKKTEMRDCLRKIDTVMKTYAAHFEPDDVDSWSHVFESSPIFRNI